MLNIPAGEFYMGISSDQVYQLVGREEWAQEWFDKDLFLGEQPYHVVNLPEFEMARFPVTNMEYSQFVWDSGYKAPRGWIGLHYSSDQDQHPVVGISRKDALAYVEWLNRKLNQTYRLPNEAEWEKAARSDDGRMYPWGGEFDPWRCNTSESAKKGTTPVGAFSPGGDSPYGVSDLIGNVWEWTTSYMLPYPFKVGEEQTFTPDLRCVVRGGAWYYSQKLARTTCREGVPIDYVSKALGFRLVRSV